MLLPSTALLSMTRNGSNTWSYNDKGSEEPIVRGIQHLEDADCICGHNIINYDIPVIRKLYPWFRDPSVVG